MSGAFLAHRRRRSISLPATVVTRSQYLSPVNGSTVTSPFLISAAGLNSTATTTAGMDVWLDGKKVGWYTGTSVNIQDTAALGTHQLDIYAVGNNNELQVTTVLFSVATSSGGGPCAQPSTPGVNICSPLNGSTVTSPVTISAAGRDNSTTEGMDVWIDGVKFGWFPGTNVSAQATLASGSHQLDIYAVGTNGELQKKTSIFTAGGSGGGGGTGSAKAINHVIFMLQENRSFDNYFGMLNPYRKAIGWNIGDDGHEYAVDGLDGAKAQIVNYNDEGTAFAPFKLATTCIDDLSSSWLESYGDVNRWDFSSTRGISMDGFVHIAEGYAKSRALEDTSGKRAMGYYDQGFLNYYYYMASQFSLSDRWFSPVSSKTVPNRIATMTGGTTQGLVHDPSNDDHIGQLDIPTIFQELDNAGVSWKIYYTDVESSGVPSTSFTYFTYSNKYVNDPTHIAPLSQFYTDVQSSTLPSFAYIEPGYNDGTDEHPGLDVIRGQQSVSNLMNALMNSPSWKDSVFFFSYDEGSPYDHVPPVPGYSNQFTDASLNIGADISSIAVNADSYNPCPIVNGSFHCDLNSYGSYADPGYSTGDAPAQRGFAAQLGFRVPNIVISPFVRRHYVSHVPMDHTAVIKFVESRFIDSSTHLTARDAAQPNLLDFFDFTAIPWANPPAPPAASTASACDPSNLTPAP
jgi:phospholipase C